MLKAFALAALFLASTAQAATITIPAPERNRDPAQVSFPDQIRENESLPVVLALHGFKTSSEYVNNFFGFSELEAARSRFVLVTPNGRKNAIGARYWNATDGCCDFERGGGDDVSYLKNLLEEVGAKLPINRKKIYAVGHSNGGFMAHRLACDTQGLLAGIASLAGATYANAALCPNLDRLAMVQIHAVDDPTIKFEGGSVFLNMPPYPSAATTVQRYVQRNGCLAATQSQSADITRSIPGNDTSMETWSGCASNAQVALWKIQAHRGGGHRPHIPTLNEEFRSQLLQFLFANSRE